MSTPSRRKDYSVIQQLIENPGLFGFSQTARLIEQHAYHSPKEAGQLNSVAHFAPPSKEIMRFKNRQTLQFSDHEIQSVKHQLSKTKKAFSKWEILVNFMGITGATGVLPYHYTELILQRNKAKDANMQAFFDLFNHRSISLFYQASTKYRLPIDYQRKQQNLTRNKTKDNTTQALLSIIGLGTKHLNERSYTRDESLLYYSGLFSHSIRTASGLKQILAHHFDIPIEIEQFIGQKRRLIKDVRSRLPDTQNPMGQNVCLGRSLMLGSKGILSQSKVRIIIKPSNAEQLQKFAPGTQTTRAINELVRLYLGIEHDHELHIEIQRNQLPKPASLEKKSCVMGWNVWLGQKQRLYSKANDVLKIKVSSTHR